MPIAEQGLLPIIETCAKEALEAIAPLRRKSAKEQENILAVMRDGIGELIQAGRDRRTEMRALSPGLTPKHLSAFEREDHLTQAIIGRKMREFEAALTDVLGNETITMTHYPSPPVPSLKQRVLSLFGAAAPVEAPPPSVFEKPLSRHVLGKCIRKAVDMTDIVDEEVLQVGGASVPVEEEAINRRIALRAQRAAGQVRETVTDVTTPTWGERVQPGGELAARGGGILGTT